MKHVLVHVGWEGRHSIDTSHLGSREASEAAALGVVERLVLLNLQHLPDRKLYESGIKYRIEARTENYATAYMCLERGYADAAEIVAWRCAELRAAGVDARVSLVRQSDEHLPIYYYTVKVLLPDGTTEDPIKLVVG